MAELKAAAEADPVDPAVLAAERLDELEKIMPFKTEADKVEVSEKLVGMTDEDFVSYKEGRVLEAKKDPKDVSDVIVATLGSIDADNLPEADMSWASRV